MKKALEREKKTDEAARYDFRHRPIAYRKTMACSRSSPEEPEQHMDHEAFPRGKGRASFFSPKISQIADGVRLQV